MKDITSDLFRVRRRAGSPVAGGILVAEPFVKECCFNHAVVSIIDYVSTEGATGVVMNNRTEYLLGELLDGVEAQEDIPVFCGGPLGQDRLYFIHTLGPDIVPRARRYAPGLYVGGDFDSIIGYINQGYPAEGAVRFFVGYSTWCEGQLDRELGQDTWALGIQPLHPSDMLRGAGDSYWHRNVRALGAAYRSWTLFPRNVAAN